MSSDLNEFVERLAGIGDELAAVTDAQARLLYAHRLLTLITETVNPALAAVRTEAAHAWLAERPDLLGAAGGGFGKGRRTQSIADLLGIAYSRAGMVLNPPGRAERRRPPGSPPAGAAAADADADATPEPRGGCS